MNCANLIDILEANFKNYADKNAYIQIMEVSEPVEITYCELEKKIKKLAGYLQDLELDNEPVLIMLANGIDYIIAFFACIYAKVIAVPAYPLKKNHHQDRLSDILKNANSKYILTDNLDFDIQRYFDYESNITLINICDVLNNETISEWRNLYYEFNTPAYIQYTSGTEFVKGSVITHGNVISNELMTKRSLKATDQEVFVNWLPIYHDMGMVGNIILSLFLGGTCVLLSAVQFICSPKVWVENISKYKGTIITAPNFAYQMCIDGITSQDMQSYSLESLRVAVNGAEQIQLDTLKEFERKFCKIGLRRGVINPSYGLAENTLITTTHSAGEVYKETYLTDEWLSDNDIVLSQKGRNIVSSGRILETETIKIADIDSDLLLADNKVGEIWIHSQSICKGYWNLTDVSEQLFHNKFPLDNKDYFSTGDIGFIKDSYLFNFGRLKDLFCINKKKYLPFDIIHTIEQISDTIIKDSSAIFTLGENNDQCIIITEVTKSLRKLKKEINEPEGYKKDQQINRLLKKIKDCVVDIYNIMPHKILLIQERSIPKTSSGKVQMQVCKKVYLNRQFKILGEL